MLVNQKPEKGAVELHDKGLIHHLQKSGLAALQPAGGTPAAAPVISDVLIYHTPVTKVPTKTPAATPDRKPPPPALAA
jgi:hypothetical protein